MRPLDLKLFRDLKSMGAQMAAIAMVMACGLMMMIMARGLIVSLETERDRYYTSNRFADVFCDLKRAPNSLRSRLAAIPNVAAVETRVKGGAILDLPGMIEPADGTMLSIPDQRPQQLNLLYLRTGRLPETGSNDEVVVSEAFAEAHGFRPGDTIDATIYGSRQRLRIVGIALSPEFVFELPPGTVTPDNRRYGVFWMNERELAIALGLDGAFNNVIVKVTAGSDVSAVKAEIDRILAPYGGLVAFDRTEHPSAQQVDDRIRVLRGFAVAFPAIFLSIAAFMTSAALTRLVRLQREQIAQLKAFGYSSGAIGLHYFNFALAVVVVATIVGGIFGLWLGSGVVILYREFYRFPELNFHPDWAALFVGLVAGAGTSFLGVFGAVRQAMKLPPAEAMRPEPPADFKPSIFERIGLHKLISPVFRMALRNLERKPWQAFFTTLGLALATAIPIVPGAMRDGVNHLMDFQWRLAQRQDVTLGFIEVGSYGALSDLRSMPGVLSAEPFRNVASRIRFGHRDRRIAITGLPKDARLNRLLDINGKPVAPPLSGLMLSSKLAEVLGVQPGETLRVEVQEGHRPVIDILVAGTITDFTGIGAYMDIDVLRRLMREGRSVSGAYLAVDPVYWNEFLTEVKEAPRIGTITTTQAAIESFDQTIGNMMGIVQAIYFSFAVIVAFGVVYNGARIALSERTRDLATLRVLGFTQLEVASVLIGELALLTLLALLPGLWIGSQLAQVLVESASTETTRIPLMLTSRTYVTAVMIVLISSGMSFAMVSRRIVKLDLLGVLKARD
jgi:putative ABC transport system permease protein